ncbi:Hypothetical protein NTJ_08734 [Nesidiocoris tenuis]|uniref:Uncharacterized protein n=1 Tax=Nesidiocoris tenuis TaxID=355587 RepID=A0ABN7AYC7_9HEMI|nr:Hypothetical protein NTJ_08734 [Nesidiocoris tenuis]
MDHLLPATACPPPPSRIFEPQKSPPPGPENRLSPGPDPPPVTLRPLCRNRVTAGSDILRIAQYSGG